MNKSKLEAESLLFWKISQDLNQPNITEHERETYRSEMEGFVMNAKDIRVRKLAADMIESLVNTIRFSAATKEKSNSNQRGLEVSINNIENGWGEYRFVAPVEFTRRIYIEFLELVKSNFSERDGKEFGADGYKIEICSLREGWDEVALSAPAAFVKRVSREFGALYAATYEARGA